MASGKLVFGPAADGNGRLVFGDQGAVVIPDADLSIDTDLPGLGELVALVGVNLSMDAELPGLDGEVALQWDANVSRVTRAALQTCWQQGQRVAGGVVSAWEQARPQRSGAIARWQEARPLAAGARTHWQESVRHRALVRSHWQAASVLRSGVRTGWEETQRLRGSSVVRWQEAAGLRHALRSGWQETQRLRAVLQTGWDDGLRLRASLGLGFGAAVPVRVRLQAVWQEAMRPRSGVTPDPALPPSKNPCYDPATLGRLVFSALADGGGRLVFVCERGGEPDPEAPQFVIPLLRVYMTVHTIDAVLLPGLERLPLKGITVSSDDDGFGWNLTASGPADPLLDMLSPVNGEPKQVKVSIDGIDFVFAVEQPERSRRFLEHAVQVRGSSVTALLGAPHVAESAWSTSVTMTAQQIILQALQFTGVDLDWRVDDWLVPTAAWSHRGTPLSVAQRVAEAAGAVLRSHRTLPTLQVAPRFPRVPWEWGAATPNVVMPGQIITTDSLQSTAGVEFNAVYVSGSVQGAIVGHVVRTGTIGDVLAPEVSDRLVTDVVSARQRGISVLSAAALKRRQTMTVPLLTGGTNPGLILPGYLIQVQEPGETWRGLVRGITVTTGVPTVRQQLVVERAG